MDLSQIKELLKIVADSGVAEVEIEEDDFKLVVRKNAPALMLQSPPMYGMGYPPPAYPPPAYPPASYAPPPAAPPPAAPAEAPAAPEAAAAPQEQKPAANEVVIKAPIVGTFYSAPSPDADPYVGVGDKVKLGDVLCIIEAMKLMNEIDCEVAGVVKQVLVENGQPVEYDQPLFVIEKA